MSAIVFQLIPFFFFFFKRQMLCSSFCIKNFTTDTSMPKSAWVAAQYKHHFVNILISPKHAECVKIVFLFICFSIIRADQLWIRDLSHTTITATSSTTFLVSGMIILCVLLACSYQHADYPSLCLCTDADGPAPLELPNQWLWDIIDEFIYQVEGLPSVYSL